METPGQPPSLPSPKSGPVSVIHYSKYYNSMSKLDTFLYMPYLVRTEIPPDLERDVAQR